jgi:hypothetical protein
LDSIGRFIVGLGISYLASFPAHACRKKDGVQLNRLDQGILYSNHLFVPDQGFEVSRQEQVTFVEQTILNHWRCKNPTCGHQWQTEEFQESEGFLEE